MKVFISGFPRAGTTMLCLMMNYFNACDVRSKEETHPVCMAEFLGNSKKYVVIKQPFGCYEDFPPPYSYESLISKYEYKIISLVRDPRDVAVSIHVLDPSRYWVSLEIIIRNCEEYLKHQGNPNVLFVRYEELVTNTESELDRISDFLGCTYRPNWVDWYKLDDAKLEKNISIGIPRKIDADGVGKYKKPEHVERMKSIMTPELQEYIKKLGYSVEE